MQMKASMKKNALFRWYREVHVRVREELQDVFDFPTRECGEHRMQRACIHTTCSERNISYLAILLRAWNFASGSMAVASCIVTSCLLMNRNSITTVSIIHTTLMCGQLRIPTPLWKATLNNVLVSVYGVQFWTISWLVLSSWKVVLQERRTSDFCRRNCPDLEDVPLNTRGCMYFKHDGAPHSSHEVRNFLNSCFPGWWIGRGGPHNWPTRSPDLSPLDYCVWGWMKTDLQCEGGNTRWIAWSHFGCRRSHQKQPMETTSHSHSSQPSGSLCCGRQWHFQKPALSIDQFKLKVISWR